MVKWKRILYQTLLTWGILLGLDLLSSVLSRRGILEADVLSDVTSFVMMTGLIAVIQGCLVGFRKMYALVILPLLFVFIQLNLVVTLFTSTDPFLPEMSDELIALNGFLLCPFVAFHWPLRGMILSHGITSCGVSSGLFSSAFITGLSSYRSGESCSIWTPCRRAIYKCLIISRLRRMIWKGVPKMTPLAILCFVSDCK